MMLHSNKACEHQIDHNKPYTVP